VAKLAGDSLPVELNKTNSYAWNYFRAVEILRKQPHWADNKSAILKKLIKLNTKQGLKLKSFKLFGATLNYVWNYFTTFDNEVYKEYPSYAAFFEFAQNFPDEFYSPDCLVRYVYLYLELIFLIKKIKPKRKKRKKFQPKVLISYLPRSGRTNIAIRLISAYLNSSSARYNVARLGDALLYLILSGKNSFLYKKKLSLYNKILEKKKFY